jgi:uncharacterized membrane protein
VDSACGHEPALDWDNFGQPFMTQYCTGCHASTWPEERREGAPLGVDFDTYSGVLEWAERIDARSVPDDADMPPGGGPSAEERALLAEWLSCRVADDAAELER